MALRECTALIGPWNQACFFSSLAMGPRVWGKESSSSSLLKYVPLFYHHSSFGSQSELGLKFSHLATQAVTLGWCWAMVWSHRNLFWRLYFIMFFAPFIVEMWMTE